MRTAISGIAAGVTALVLGLLISGASAAAHAADVAHRQAVAVDAAKAAASTQTTSAELQTYHQRLQEALTRLDASYRELQARDAAYRELLAKSDANAAQLQRANAQLASQLATAADEIRRIQAAQTPALAAGGPAPGAASLSRHGDDD